MTISNVMQNHMSHHQKCTHNPPLSFFKKIARYSQSHTYKHHSSVLLLVYLKKTTIVCTYWIQSRVTWGKAKGQRQKDTVLTSGFHVTNCVHTCHRVGERVREKKRDYKYINHNKRTYLWTFMWIILLSIWKSLVTIFYTSCLIQ